MRIFFLIAVALAAVWFFQSPERPELARDELNKLIEEIGEREAPSVPERARRDLDALIERLNEIPGREWEARISDGKFSELSEKWRNGINWLITTGKCRVYDVIIWNAVDGNRFKYLLAKAQMMVESGCRFDIVGGGTDKGLFQVQERACEDAGVDGDLFDPEANVRCALAYHRTLCRRYGKCATTERLVAYNAGPTGSEKIKEKRAFEYARKIHFALKRLRAHTEQRVAAR